MKHYQKSLEWYERAQRWTPGASQTMSKSPARYPVGAHPLALTRGRGCHVWDLDGNEFIDWSLALAAVTLGYDYSQVACAIQQHAADGISFSLPHPLEARVAERICGIFPCAHDGAIRFVKTGSEADSAACRIARRYTQRNAIWACGYLGWHDWAMSRAPEHPGVTFAYDDREHPLIYGFEIGQIPDENNWDTVYWDDCAAIFIEPPLFPPAGLDVKSWLQSLKTLAHEHGALLIFDEVVTGFRFALGGAQEYFGITPDLCTFGKGCSNGMPLAGIAGPREIMQYADVISGTFGGETLSLAACNATLDVYEREPVIKVLWERGDAFKNGLSRLITRHGLPAIIEGYPVHPRLKWFPPGEFFYGHGYEEDNKRDATLLMSLWLQEMAEGGVLVHHGGWNVSYSHTAQDVQDSLAAADRAFGICAEALAEGRIRERLRGAVISEGFKVR